jgi:hypothetical protein
LRIEEARRQPVLQRRTLLPMPAIGCTFDDNGVTLSRHESFRYLSGVELGI